MVINSLLIISLSETAHSFRCNITDGCQVVFEANNLLYKAWLLAQTHLYVSDRVFDHQDNLCLRVQESWQEIARYVTK